MIIAVFMRFIQKLQDDVSAGSTDTMQMHVDNLQQRETLYLFVLLFSTIAMAFAFHENESSGRPTGRITSMEDMDEWYRHARALLPGVLSSYFDLVHSPKVEYTHLIFRGVGYQAIPPRAYDFIFVDGPQTTTPSDGTSAFDFDLVNVVQKTEKPVFAVVDKRGHLLCPAGVVWIGKSPLRLEM